MPQVLQQNTLYVAATTVADFVAKKASSILASIAATFEAISVANARTHEIERMNLLTDKELADLYRINRDQIVPYVFRDKMI